MSHHFIDPDETASSKVLSVRDVNVKKHRSVFNPICQLCSFFIHKVLENFVERSCALVHHMVNVWIVKLDLIWLT